MAEKVLLLVGVSAISVLLLEWAVRGLYPFYHPKAQIGFVLTTNGIALGPANQSMRHATPKGDFDIVSEFNSDGFRDTKNLREAGPGDWFALGDSFTMGWGVAEQDRFSNLLEKSFASARSTSRVFNIAIPDNIIGYQRLVRYAESCGARVNHVVVGICMENDLRDYSDGKGAWDPLSNPAGAAGTKSSKREAIRGWMKGHSALYNALSFGLQRSPTIRRILERFGVSRSLDELNSKNQWNEKVLQSSRDEIIKLLSGRDACVLIIPSRRLWVGEDTQTELRVHEAFVGMLRQSNLKFLDMKPALEKTGEPLAHYFKTDPHWNPKGHALAARELFLILIADHPPQKPIPIN